MSVRGSFSAGLFIALLACAAPAPAQVPEDIEQFGPYPVGVQLVSFGPGPGTVLGQTYDYSPGAAVQAKVAALQAAYDSAVAAQAPPSFTPVVFAPPSIASEEVRLLAFYPATEDNTFSPPATPFDPTAHLDRPAVSGRFPVVAFHHGFGGDPGIYRSLCAHIASWGFLVLAVHHLDGSEGYAGRQSPVNQALDMLAGLELTLAAAAAQDSRLRFRGQIDPEMTGYAAAGHSMGGSGAAYLAHFDPRVETLVTLEAGQADRAMPVIVDEGTGETHVCLPDGLRFLGDLAQPAADAFDGGRFLIAGAQDTLAPSGAVRWWFEQDGATPRRNLFVELPHVGHFGPTDNVLGIPGGGAISESVCGAPAGISSIGEMSGDDQHRLHRRLLTGTLRAEHGTGVNDGEDLYHFVLGPELRNETFSIAPLPGLHPIFAAIEADCAQPIIWVAVDDVLPDTLDIGIVGRRDDVVGGLFRFIEELPFPGPGADPFAELGFTLNFQELARDASGSSTFNVYLGTTPAPGIVVLDIPFVLPDMVGRESGFLAYLGNPESSSFTRMTQLATIRL